MSGCIIRPQWTALLNRGAVFLLCTALLLSYNHVILNEVRNPGRFCYFTPDPSFRMTRCVYASLCDASLPPMGGGGQRQSNYQKFFDYLCENRPTYSPQ